jgi:predicted ArsR family transcriptional regulator
VNFDGLTKCWQSLGDVEEVLMSETKQEILSYLEGAGKSSLASIAQGLGKDKSNVNKNLQDLTNDGKVRKEYIEGKVFYEKV